MDTETIIIIVLSAVIFIMILGFGLYYAYSMNKAGDVLYEKTGLLDDTEHQKTLFQNENETYRDINAGLGENLRQKDIWGNTLARANVDWQKENRNLSEHNEYLSDKVDDLEADNKGLGSDLDSYKYSHQREYDKNIKYEQELQKKNRIIQNLRNAKH